MNISNQKSLIVILVSSLVVSSVSCGQGKFRSITNDSESRTAATVAEVSAKKQSSDGTAGPGDLKTTAAMCRAEQVSPKGRKKTNVEVIFSLEDLTGYSFRDVAHLLPPNPGSETFPAAAGPLAWDKDALAKQLAFAQEVAERLQRDVAFSKRYGIDPDNFKNEDIPVFVDRVATMFLGGARSADLLDTLSRDFDVEGPGRKEGFFNGVRSLVFRLILDPHFLYEVETGEGRDALWTARRLALILWRSVPDRELLIHASKGGFQTQEGLLSQVKRMLASSKAKRAFRSFVKEWLASQNLANSQRSLMKFPDFAPELLAEMEADYIERVVDVLFDKKGRGRDLFQVELKDPPTRLGAVIARGSAPDSDDGKSASLPRKGLLTHPALASLTSVGDEPNAVKRATYTLQRFLCIDLPPPPGGANVFQALDLGPAPTTRERFKVHTKNPSCASCHSTLDGIGLAMEQFDALGYFRTKYDSGKLIDPEGSLAAYGKTIHFSGVAELQEQLIQELSEPIDQCLTRHVMEFTYRAVSSDVPKCEVESLHKRIVGGGFVSTIVEVVLTPGFWAR